MSDACMNHIEGYWQTLTMAANDFFNKGDFEKALEGYKDALYRAEVLNNNIEDCLRTCIPFMQVYIISCNNLAQAYQAAGQRQEAERMLKRVVYYLLHLAELEDFVQMDELRSELRRASIALLDFSEKSAEGVKKREKVLEDVST